MKKVSLFLLALSLSFSLAACSSPPTEEEIIAAAQNASLSGLVGGYDKTVGEFIASATAFPEWEWYIVTEESPDADALNDLRYADEFDPETEALVCLQIGNYETEAFSTKGKFYIAVNTEDLSARICQVLYANEEVGSGVDSAYNASYFVILKDAVNEEDIISAAEGVYLPGYPDKTLLEYAEAYTVLDGGYQFDMASLTADVAKGVPRYSARYDIERDALAECKIHRQDVDYRFYIAVDQETFEPEVVAVSVYLDRQNRMFYDSEVDEVASIFVDAANWAE